MDFKRIEWIFFLAFLGLNVFLFNIYSEARSEQQNVLQSNQTIPIEQRLASKDQVLYGDEYHYRKNLSLLDQEYPTIVASQSYETIPFNDSSSRIDMTLASSDKLLQIAKYTQTHISNITPLREKMTLYSEKEAVNTLYLNNKLPSHSKILWTELAYTRILIVGDRNVYIPAWFVAVKADADVNIQIETVNAFSNRIITNNAVQKVENP